MRRLRQRHSRRTRDVVPEVGLDERKCVERSKVRLLPNGLLRILRPSGDPRCEVANLHDLIVRQEAATECFQVEPFVGCALDRAVVEVEAVDVDDRRHRAI